MDNLSIDVTAEGKEALKKAFEIVWPLGSKRMATHYKVLKVGKQEKFWAKKPDERCKANAEIEGTKEPLYIWSYATEHPDKDGAETLVFLSYVSDSDSKAIKCLHPLTLEQAFDAAWGWLGQVSFGKEPDHDGDNHKGFRAFTDFWGHVAGNQGAIVGVQPAWAMYGK